jgi:energy-coupling factor transporter ATP-binding protein EcfA2
VLRAIEIRNFKSFGASETRIEMAPLTILAGPNGAGKSTVLQVIDVLGSLVRGNIDQLLDAHQWDYADLPLPLTVPQSWLGTLAKENAAKYPGLTEGYMPPIVRKLLESRFPIEVIDGQRVTLLGRFESACSRALSGEK